MQKQPDEQVVAAVKANQDQPLFGLFASSSAVRTNLWRWRERVLSTPAVLTWGLLLRALRNRKPALALECPADAPLFVLSTGRSGTITLAALLSLTPRSHVWHEPNPDFWRLARHVCLTPGADRQLVGEALLLARGPLWQSANLAGKRYVEVSHQVTFLAPFIRDLLPDARFLHLSRAPEPFALSATRFGFYSTRSRSARRPAPRPDSPLAAEWESFDPFTRNVWYWREVNTFARDFLKTLPPGQGLHLRAEDIFSGRPDTLQQLYALVDSEPPPRRRIQRVLGRHLNAGRYRSGSRPVDTFAPAQRDLLERECGALARELGYAGIDG